MRNPRRPAKKTERVSAPKPAPGELEIIQAFLNTVDLRAGTDELTLPRDLSEWLARRGLLAANTKLSRTDVGRAHDVRDGMRALVEANCGAELDKDAVQRLDEAAGTARPRLRFHGDGSDRFDSADFDQALGHLIALVALARRQGLWEKLKICGNRECRAVFFDFSNNPTKWCTVRCGDRLRARKYRRTERYRQRPSHKPPRLPAIFRELDD